MEGQKIIVCSSWLEIVLIRSSCCWTEIVQLQVVIELNGSIFECCLFSWAPQQFPPVVTMDQFRRLHTICCYILSYSGSSVSKWDLWVAYENESFSIWGGHQNWVVLHTCVIRLCVLLEVPLRTREKVGWEKDNWFRWFGRNSQCHFLCGTHFFTCVLLNLISVF